MKPLSSKDLHVMMEKLPWSNSLFIVPAKTLTQDLQEKHRLPSGVAITSNIVKALFQEVKSAFRWISRNAAMYSSQIINRERKHGLHSFTYRELKIKLFLDLRLPKPRTESDWKTVTITPPFLHMCQ